MLRPLTRARNAVSTQPLGPRSRARPDTTDSGRTSPAGVGVVPAGVVPPGVTPPGVTPPGVVAGWVSGIDAESVG